MITKNNDGVEVCSLKMSDLENTEKNNVIESIESENGKIMKLNPLSIGDRIIRQEIEVNEKENETTLKTFNDFDEIMDI